MDMIERPVYRVTFRKSNRTYCYYLHVDGVYQSGWYVMSNSGCSRYFLRVSNRWLIDETYSVVDVECLADAKRRLVTEFNRHMDKVECRL